MFTSWFLSYQRKWLICDYKVYVRTEECRFPNQVVFVSLPTLSSFFPQIGKYIIPRVEKEELWKIYTLVKIYKRMAKSIDKWTKWAMQQMFCGRKKRKKDEEKIQFFRLEIIYGWENFSRHSYLNYSPPISLFTTLKINSLDVF